MYDMPRFTGHRWPDAPPTYGIEDPQCADPAAYCAQCGGEIYPREAYYTDTPNAPGSKGAVTLHPDCLLDWVRDQGTAPAAEAFGFVKLP